MALEFEGNKQTRLYSAEINNIARGNSSAVLTGCGVTVSSPAAMTVEVDSGNIFFGNDTIAVTAQTSSTFDNNTTSYNRLDLLAVNASGVISIIKGTEQEIIMTPDYDVDSYIILAIVKIIPSQTTIETTNIRDIRILNEGGGSSGSGGGINRFKEDFTTQTSVTVTHNLGDDEPIVQVYLTNGEMIIPSKIDIIDQNNVTVEFSSAQSGHIIIHGGIGGTSYYSEDYTSATSWSVVHNLGRKYVTVQCFNSSDELIEPQTVTLTDEDNLVVIWGVATAGRVVITGGATDSNISGVALTTIAESDADNNSIFLDESDNEIKIKNNVGDVRFTNGTLIKQIYTGTDLDISSVTSSNHELNTITSAQLIGKDYIYMVVNLQSVARANTISLGTNYLKIETKDVGGSYSDSFANSVIGGRGYVTASGNFGFNSAYSLTWIHTLTANEKSAGIDIRFTTEITGIAGSITNKQIVIYA